MNIREERVIIRDTEILSAKTLAEVLLEPLLKANPE